MWRMLCEATQTQGREHWRLDFQIGADGCSAHWEAHYLFSATGRLVHNRIDATFSFDGQGRIASHRDRFDFWRWSRQALGLPGLLLGWSGGLRNKVRQQAAKNLARYRARRP
jgi:hypothetical protein